MCVCACFFPGSSGSCLSLTCLADTEAKNREKKQTIFISSGSNLICCHGSGNIKATKYLECNGHIKEYTKTQLQKKELPSLCMHL